MLKRLSISNRLLLFIPVLLVSLAVTIWFGLSEIRSNLLEDRKDMIKQLVQVATTIVDGWYQKEKSGQLSHEDAQKGARDELWRLRYADNNYLFIQRYDGLSMLQLDRSLEGKNRIDSTDPYGVPTVRRLVEAAQRGGGYVYYHATRTGGVTSDAKNTAPKLSYAFGYDPWQWSIGTGIYIDDVDAAYNRIALLYGALGLVILTLAIALAYLIARSISRPLSLITEQTSRLAEGDLAVAVSFLEEAHEVGRLARALDVFKTNRRKADEMVAVQRNEQATKLRRQEAVEMLINDFHDRTTRVIEAVMHAAERVQSLSGDLAEMATQSRSRIAAVNQASNDTTGNVQSIAGAAEELSTAVGEVSRQASESTAVAERAVNEADETNTTMRSLAASANRIGEVERSEGAGQPDDQSHRGHPEPDRRYSGRDLSCGSGNLQYRHDSERHAHDGDGDRRSHATTGHDNPGHRPPHCRSGRRHPSRHEQHRRRGRSCRDHQPGGRLTARRLRGSAARGDEPQRRDDSLL